MFVLYNKQTGRLTEVARVQNPKADLETQGEVEIDDQANADVFVTTPSGQMLLCDALMKRTLAFTVENDELLHDTEWETML